MQKKDIPQDTSSLNQFTKEICYALDDKGNYVTDLSKGWDVKASALGVTWDEISVRIAQAKKLVLEDKSSPILYYMELRLMDPGILAAYTGFWKWQVKRHLKPNVFRKLSAKSIQKYADVFELHSKDLRPAYIHDNNF